MIRLAGMPRKAKVRWTGPVWIAVVALYVLAGIISPAMFQFPQMVNILR